MCQRSVAKLAVMVVQGRLVEATVRRPRARWAILNMAVAGRARRALTSTLAPPPIAPCVVPNFRRQQRERQRQQRQDPEDATMVRQA